MKELSIEEKAKAYDEALARANEMIKAMTNIGGVAKVDDIQHIFPELKESEDERIRKEMITYLSTVEDKELIPYESWITWLEKQGEKGTNGNEREIPNSAWSEEDEKMFNSALWHVKNSCGNSGKNSGEFEVYNWLESLKERVQLQSKQEWSEEDERIYKSIIYSFAHNYPLTAQQQEFVKSLRPQNTWKPSDEQMDALLYEVNAWDEDFIEKRVKDGEKKTLKFISVINKLNTLFNKVMQDE